MKISCNGVKPYSFLANNIKTETKYIPPKEFQDTFELTAKEIAEKSTRNFSQNPFSSSTTTSFKGGITNLSLYFEMRKKLKKANLPQFMKNNIISCSDSKERKLITNKFLSDEKLYSNENLQKHIEYILHSCDRHKKAEIKINLMEEYISDPKLYKNKNIQKTIGDIVSSVDTEEQKKIADIFLLNEKLHENLNIQEKILQIIYYCNTAEQTKIKLDLLNKYISDGKLCKNEYIQKRIGNIINWCNAPEQSVITDKFFSEPKLYENKNIQEEIGNIISDCYVPEKTKIKLDLINKYISETKLYENKNIQEIIGNIISQCNMAEKSTIADKFLSDEKLYNNENLQKIIGNIISQCDTVERNTIADKFLSDKKIYENSDIQKNINSIISSCENQENSNAIINLMDKYITDPKLYENSDIKETIGKIILSCNTDHFELKALDMIQKGIVPSKLIQKANNKLDFNIAVNFFELYGKNNINEIPIYEKRNVINNLVKNNVDLFKISDELTKELPLIPKNKKEYCNILPVLVKSLGIETNPISEEQIEKFNSDIDKLANTLKDISDEEFNNMVLTQKYSKDEFIEGTLEIIKDLPKNEQQKVCNVFGFELRQNAKNGYTISGYPFTPSDSEKFADITDEASKEAVEKLREKVIAFTQDNKVSSNITKIEPVLNDILTAMPELHTLFNKTQHGAHKFDVMKHSLKVMQKIIQNPEFEKLNNSDKKIMFLAALLHDITKQEMISDSSHPVESSFDAFYITKKFNLSQEEQLKLYSLIRNHEWLKYVNQKDLTEKERTKILQSVAFDFQNDNLFDMAKIFTESDLKSISDNDELFPSFKEAFCNYPSKINDYILKLKKTKPILPTTKLPKASEIADKITVVNEDCSTNIKGLYQKDGLIIIKYNEVEDWEALGFPKGSTSKGIKADNPFEYKEIDTGNIKFIAHGLDYEGQLTNFDAFALPDSDALLSVSYMGRPESKYRLFREHGVLLDVDSKYIYGGGETDSGSGCKKDISEFKKNYTFGGVREGDRKFISELIKETLNLDDEEYIKFIKNNQNKSFLEIEPVEAREKLIKQFALINSSTRRGNREYNEMYISNPKVQGVFAYSYEDAVGKISDFIEEKEDWLKNYAKTNDLPFFIFGD